jgi:hypothetical protein
VIQNWNGCPTIHLDGRALGRAGEIDADQEPLRQGAETEPEIPLHRGVELAEIPRGRDAAELGERHELDPVDAEPLLHRGPARERVPPRDHPDGPGVRVCGC